MNFEKDENPTYYIFIHVDANVLLSTQRIAWENLNKKVTVRYFLDTLKLQRHSVFITQKPW